MKAHWIPLIDSFRDKKVLVIGDAILDVYVKGEADRICREAPVPVVNIQAYDNYCGGAANTAINLAALGAETYFLTLIGQDSHAETLLSMLEKHGVRTEYVLQDKQRSTIAKKRVTVSNSILLRLDEGDTEPLSTSAKRKLSQKLKRIYVEFDAVVVSDYEYGLITASFLKALASLRREKGPLLVIDSRKLHKYKNLHPDAVKPNYEELVHLMNLPKLNHEQRLEQIYEHQKAISEATAAGLTAVTLDIDGVVLLEANREPYYVPVVPKDPRNSVGAGDTFVAAMTLALAGGAGSNDAIELAAAAAAVVTQHEYTLACTADELKSSLLSAPKYVSSTAEMDHKLAELREEGKKIVFTNGCFDLLHSGHMELLNRARNFGDVLIVGLNTDKSIRRVKGDGRPHNSLPDRLTILSNLQCVDYLIAFDEDSPSQLIRAIKPDVFVKGSDYTTDALPEAGLIHELGGEVRIVPVIKNHSVSELIRKIKASGSASNILSRKNKSNVSIS